MKPKLRTIMLLIATAVILWTISGLVPWRGLELALQAFMFLCGAVAVYQGMFHLAYQLADIAKSINAARTAINTEPQRIQYESLKIVKDFTDAQCAAVGRLRVEIEVLPGAGTTPMYTLILPGANIPWDFYGEEFYNQCTSTHLAPVRRWSNGSKKHEYADALTLYMIDRGYAVYNPGNESTNWINENKRLAGWTSIGIEE
jgi:hypothetical protein